MGARSVTALGGHLASQRIAPGDLAMFGEVINTLTTAGAGTLLGAHFASGLLLRTGPVGGYTDTPDTATNILQALGYIAVAGGNNNIWGAGLTDLNTGSTFRWRFMNGVAQAMTFGTGVEGIIYGSGTLNVAASLWRDYLVTIGNITPRQSLSVSSTNASAVVTFTTPQPMGTITPGMWLSGTNVTSGTLVLGVTHGQGVITGFTANANATGTGTQAWVFSPTVRFDSLGTGTY